MNPREIALSLGANLGDRKATFQWLVKRLETEPGITVTGKSPLYETDPVGVKPEYQHLAFLNAVVLLESARETNDLHQALLAIETEGGRLREGDRYAPRSLDIDILYAGNELRNDHLKLPHPQCRKRRFVLQPMSDLRPDLILPGETRTVAELLAALPDGEAVRRLEEAW